MLYLVLFAPCVNYEPGFVSARNLASKCVPLEPGEMMHVLSARPPPPDHCRIALWYTLYLFSVTQQPFESIENWWCCYYEGKLIKVSWWNTVKMLQLICICHVDSLVASRTRHRCAPSINKVRLCSTPWLSNVLKDFIGRGFCLGYRVI